RDLRLEQPKPAALSTLIRCGAACPVPSFPLHSPPFGTTIHSLSGVPSLKRLVAIPVNLSCPHCPAPFAIPHLPLGKRVRCRRCNGVFQATPPAPSEAILDALPVDEPRLAAPLPQRPSPSVRHVDEEEDRSRVAWIVGGAVAGVALLVVTGVLLWIVHASDDRGASSGETDARPFGVIRPTKKAQPMIVEKKPTFVHHP